MFHHPLGTALRAVSASCIAFKKQGEVPKEVICRTHLASLFSITLLVDPSEAEASYVWCRIFAFPLFLIDRSIVDRLTVQSKFWLYRVPTKEVGEVDA